MMKHYLVLCPEANKQGLPWKSGLRTHFLEHSSTYSIKDLVDLQNGILVDEINAVYDTMRNHITDFCDLCKARYFTKYQSKKKNNNKNINKFAQLKIYWNSNRSNVNYVDKKVNRSIFLME